MPRLTIVGPYPLAKVDHGGPISRIGTLFPEAEVLVTLPGIHATQRMAYVEWENRRRAESGRPPLTDDECSAAWNKAVDLIMEDEAILIRPDPDNMELAFRADELLQELFCKCQIKFLHILNAKVRQAIKGRGECWRINPLPRSPEEMKRMIASSRIGIGGREIYYYNKATGTRLLTYQNFAALAALGESELRRHLAEIKTFSARFNPQHNREIAFFLAGKAFSAADFADYDFATIGVAQLAAAYEMLRAKFCDAVAAEFRQDDIDNLDWRNRMCAMLIGQEDEAIPEETLLGLSPEFFMQIEWLPGGRIEEGELIFDPILEEASDTAAREDLKRLCDEKSRKLIYNFVREYGDLEYVNIGRVIGSLSRRPDKRGRRGVYIAEIKQRGRESAIISIIRMQKWGIREHLDEGKCLLDAIIESEEYTEYTLDRRLGCRQLGMNLPPRVTARRTSEKYAGQQQALEGILIWSPYFERDYIRGIATDKLPGQKFHNQAYAEQCARLLGRAAAPNMIVGRSDLCGKVLFDDGDEVIIEDQAAMPVEIVVTDQTGTFSDFCRDLCAFAAAYAAPVNRRVKYVENSRAFAEAYLAAFVERFSAVQDEYRKRKRAFDTLFKHRRRDEGGSFAFRWERVLERLNATDVREVAKVIESSISLG